MSGKESKPFMWCVYLPAVPQAAVQFLQDKGTPKIKLLYDGRRHQCHPIANVCPSKTEKDTAKEQTDPNPTFRKSKEA